jgi:hypothetical protein
MTHGPTTRAKFCFCVCRYGRCGGALGGLLGDDGFGDEGGFGDPCGAVGVRGGGCGSCGMTALSSHDGWRIGGKPELLLIEGHQVRVRVAARRRVLLLLAPDGRVVLRVRLMRLDAEVVGPLELFTGCGEVFPMARVPRLLMRRQ